jgi:large-conductance mechanosensitive channel
VFFLVKQINRLKINLAPSAAPASKTDQLLTEIRDLLQDRAPESTSPL